MVAVLPSYEVQVRIGVFLAVLAVLALWELAAPRRPLQQRKLVRWANNLALTFLDSLLVRALLPVAAVGVAAFAAERGLGLLNAIALPYPLTIAVSVLLLDLAIYLQHRVFHALPLLWRLHRVHHADLDIDVTTGTRFHPFEILLSMLIKFAVILVLGPPALAVLVFEIVLNATSMFNHANLRLPGSVDRALRWLVVTPDMHRVHHSIDRRETDSNFGFNVPWWDRLFGTYRAQPTAGHDAMTIGLQDFRAPRELRLDRMLLQPFRSAGGDDPSAGHSDGSDVPREPVPRRAAKG